MFIVLLGAPGSGKGTVAEILKKNLNIVHISTGDLFRENLNNQTELGKKVKEYMERGELVPDEITVAMLANRMISSDVENGAIFDGFPRTKAQAESLDELLEKSGHKIDMALNIDVPFEEVIERIANRRSCRGCNSIYNMVYNPPKKENICDECGGEIYQRDDQKPEIVKNRLEIYEKTADELIKYYAKSEVLLSIKAGEREGKDSYCVAKEAEEFLENKLLKENK